MNNGKVRRQKGVRAKAGMVWNNDSQDRSDSRLQMAANRYATRTAASRLLVCVAFLYMMEQSNGPPSLETSSAAMMPFHIMQNSSLVILPSLFTSGNGENNTHNQNRHQQQLVQLPDCPIHALARCFLPLLSVLPASWHLLCH